MRLFTALWSSWATCVLCVSAKKTMSDTFPLKATFDSPIGILAVRHIEVRQTGTGGYAVCIKSEDTYDAWFDLSKQAARGPTPLRVSPAVRSAEAVPVRIERRGEVTPKRATMTMLEAKCGKENKRAAVDTMLDDVEAQVAASTVSPFATC